MTRGHTEALVSAAAEGRSLTEIAAAAGVSVSTVQRRLRDQDIVGAINEVRTQQRSEAVGQLAGLRSEAIARLHTIIYDENAQISLRAIALVLRTSATFDNVHDLDRRVSALESPPPEDETEEAQLRTSSSTTESSRDGQP